MTPLKSVVGRVAALPASTRAALFMLAQCLGLALMVVMVRVISKDMHALQIGFFRFFFGFLCMVPWMVTMGWESLRTRHRGQHALRAFTGVSAMLFGFTAVTLMPLAEATALTFTTPLFATAAAALILKEVVRVRRWTAIAVGFCGTLVILRPGAEAISLPAVFALTGAFFAAMSVISLKILSRTESARTVLVYMGIFMTPMSLIPALFVWRTPDLATLGLLAVLGLLGTLTNVAMVRALSLADAAAVLPFDFTRLLYVAVLAYVLFGEVPDVWTWVGAGIIFAAVVYTARREAQLARQAGRRPPRAAPQGYGQALPADLRESADQTGPDGPGTGDRR